LDGLTPAYAFNNPDTADTSGQDNVYDDANDATGTQTIVLGGGSATRCWVH